MGPNPQETADIVIFTEEILNEKLYSPQIQIGYLESDPEAYIPK